MREGNSHTETSEHVSLGDCTSPPLRLGHYAKAFIVYRKACFHKESTGGCAMLSPFPGGMPARDKHREQANNGTRETVVALIFAIAKIIT